MFTGLIDHQACVQRLERHANEMMLTIATEFTSLSLGESIAVDGVCLTVTAIKDATFACAASPETIRLTTIGDYQEGSFVNVERALSLQDRLGGHFVMGHVDAVLTVSSIQPHRDFLQVDFSGVESGHRGYLIPKGSVAINGVSLTINALTPAGFSVMLIPHTIAQTNFNALKAGQAVNVEYDHLAKCVAHQLDCLKKEISLACGRVKVDGDSQGEL